MFSEKEKGDWYDEKLRSYRVDFGPILFEKKRLGFIDPKFISLIKHAAIASCAILNREGERSMRNYSFRVKEIIHLSNNQRSKYFFKILNIFSDKIFKSSMELYEQNCINMKLDITLRKSPFQRGVSDFTSIRSLDRLIGNILFTSQFTDLSNSFFKNNPLHKIDDLKDAFLEELINEFNNNSQIKNLKNIKKIKRDNYRN